MATSSLLVWEYQHATAPIFIPFVLRRSKPHEIQHAVLITLEPIKTLIAS